MATNPRPRDISELPELLRLAEEVMTSRAPLLLTSGDRPVALLTPVELGTAGRPRRKGRGSASEADSLLNIIGIGESSEPTDIGRHKPDYLADAYAAERG